MANQKEPGVWIFVIVGVVALIGGGVIGYFIGQANGAQTAAAKYAPIVQTAFPAPSGTLYNLQGTVQNVYGATIALTVQDPSDYLPHLDGSPRATQTRNAQTTPNTKFFSVDNAHLDGSGNPTRTAIKLSDIQPGDTVMVRSAQNIFSASTFDVTEVDLLK